MCSTYSEFKGKYDSTPKKRLPAVSSTTISSINNHLENLNPRKNAINWRE